MHDSRGAQLKVGDRVLIEAEVTELQAQADPDYCNVTVKAITPEQKDKTPMVPPSGMVFNTKMLTKVGAAIFLLLCSCATADAGPFAARRGSCSSAAGCSAPAVAVAVAAPASKSVAEARLILDRPVVGWIVNAGRVIWWVVHPGWFGGGFPRPGPVAEPDGRWRPGERLRIFKRLRGRGC